MRLWLRVCLVLLAGLWSPSLSASSNSGNRASPSSGVDGSSGKLEQQLAAILAAISSSSEKTERALAELKREVVSVKSSITTTQQELRQLREDSNLMLGTMFQPSCDAIAQAQSNQQENTVVGVYTIKPPNGGTAQVRCELNRSMGWTVVMSRMDGSQPFDKTYAEYQQGFGNPSGEHWIGLDVLHRLTSSKVYQLRVLLEDFDGKKEWVVYKKFQVGSPEDKYRLTVGDHEADSRVGDGFAIHNGMPFSTHDQDNDKRTDANCAKMFGGGGGWWYNTCYNVLPTGAYRKTGGQDWGGVAWWPWRNQKHSLKAITLMIRPKDY